MDGVDLFFADVEQRHFVRFGKMRAEQAAHGARAENGNFHGSNPP